MKTIQKIINLKAILAFSFVFLMSGKCGKKGGKAADVKTITIKSIKVKGGKDKASKDIADYIDLSKDILVASDNSFDAEVVIELDAEIDPKEVVEGVTFNLTGDYIKEVKDLSCAAVLEKKDKKTTKQFKGTFKIEAADKSKIKALADTVTGLNSGSTDIKTLKTNATATIKFKKDSKGEDKTSEKFEKEYTVLPA